MENICQRMRSGGAHQAITYGSLDPATGGRILQRLVDLRALTPGMLAAFRGCPVAELSLDKNPRATNALLAELGRKVYVCVATFTCFVPAFQGLCRPRLISCSLLLGGCVCVCECVASVVRA